MTIHANYQKPIFGSRTTTIHATSNLFHCEKYWKPVYNNVNTMDDLRNLGVTLIKGDRDVRGGFCHYFYKGNNYQNLLSASTIPNPFYGFMLYKKKIAPQDLL